MNHRPRKVLAVVLLLLGAGGALVSLSEVGWRHWTALGLAAVVALSPASAKVFRWSQRMRRVSPRARVVTTVAVFIASLGYLTFTAFRQDRPLYPKYHDNQSYAIQAQIIASGKLWLPPHPHWEFFDTFHVIVTPVYASMYFPGSAMVYAVGLLLHWPHWVIPMLIAAACVAMLYRVVAETVDGLSGLLAALWLVSLLWFRHHSTMYMSHPVLLLIGLMMFWAYLRWRRSNRLMWALLIGMIAGFGAITRPADALCYAAPIGIAMLYALRGRRLGFLAATGVIIVAGAAPFLALQLVFNRGVTGDALTSPYRFYLDRDAPQLSFGFHKLDPQRVPQSSLQQKRDYHRRYNIPLINAHRVDRLITTWLSLDNWRPGRLRLIMEATLPSMLLLPVVFVGVLGLTTMPRVALFALLPLYCLLYLFYAALLKHYTPVVAPAVILLGVLGVRQLGAVWPAMRARLATLGIVAVAGSCIAVLPELNPGMQDDPFEYIELKDARVNIPPNVQLPALVFVKYTPDPDANIHGEPVYNWEAAEIDDNPIVFAHDLGPDRNIELLRYYAQRQPQRHIYYFDRSMRKRLLSPEAGTVVDELNRLMRAATRPATGPATGAATVPAPAGAPE